MKKLNGYQGLTSEVVDLIIQNTNLDRNKVNNEIDKIVSCFKNKKIDIKKLDSLLNNRNKILTMSRNKENIMAKPVRSDHVDTYGPLAWIAGFAFAVLITWMMFYIADGFS